MSTQTYFICGIRLPPPQQSIEVRNISVLGTDSFLLRESILIPLNQLYQPLRTADVTFFSAFMYSTLPNKTKQNFDLWLDSEKLMLSPSPCLGPRLSVFQHSLVCPTCLKPRLSHLQFVDLRLQLLSRCSVPASGGQSQPCGCPFLLQGWAYVPLVQRKEDQATGIAPNHCSRDSPQKWWWSGTSHVPKEPLPCGFWPRWVGKTLRK